MVTARSVPATRKRPRSNIEVRLGRLQEVRGDPLALGDHLVGGEPQRRPADDGRPGSHRPRAEGDPVRVTVDVADRVGVEAEPLVEHLLECGLVALPLALRAHQDGRAAARVEPDLRELGLGRRRPLDGVDHGQAPEPAPPARRLAPGGEPRDVGERRAPCPCSSRTGRCRRSPGTPCGTASPRPG